MLPSHNQARPSESSTASATSATSATSAIKHYTIRSSDVLNQSPRITVSDGDNVLWYKTRELTEHEIVDSVVDCKTNQIRWTIHQPKRGWYLRLRSPLFPPGACIALKPPESRRSAEGNGSGSGNGPSITTTTQDATLTFGCQTLVPQVLPNLNDHSYPPSRNSTSSRTSISSLTPRSPKTVTVTPAQVLEVEETKDITDPHTARPGQAGSSDSTTTSTTPTPNPNPNSTAIAAALANMSVSSKPNKPINKPPPPRWQVTHYILQLGIPQDGPLAGMHHHHHLVEPSSNAPHTSFLHRALAPLANFTNVTSHHFTIQPTLPVGLASIPSPSSASALIADPLNSPNPSTPLAPQQSQFQSQLQPQSQLPTQGINGFGNGVPLLAFTDSTPILTATPSGTISVDTDTVRALGVEMAFWVAVSLAFWEFLRDRDGYLAAAED